MTIETFEGFGLPATLAACLTKMNYTTPTPIQAQAIPFALDGRDILGSAQTGTGKTAAFSIPMIAAMINDPTLSAVVLTPTRELAMQVMDVAKQMIERGTGIRTALLIGGEQMYKQFKQLNDRPRLIIGTPGRVNDHLRRNPNLFDQTRFIVLDEADRMLDMGFSVQIDTILDACAEERQTLMFSATFAPKILKFAQTYLKNPQRVEIASAKTSADNIDHQYLPVSHDKKYDTLRAELEARTGSVIVFVKTKHGADKMARRLSDDSYGAAALHGGLNQRQRERTTRQFRAQEHRILVATDVAARGLDIPHVEHVINYDMPMVAEDYIHRIGRTARAGAKGNALAIVSPQDSNLWRDVERLLNPRNKDERGGNFERSDDGRKPFRKGPFGNKGGFKKNARSDDNRGEGFKKEGFKKNFRNDDNRDGGFKKEGFKKNFRNDDSRDGGFKKEGFKKNFRNDDSRDGGFKKEGFKKNFRSDDNRDGGFKKEGFKKNFRNDDNREGGFKKDGFNKKPDFKKRDERDDFFGDRPVYAERQYEDKPLRNKGNFNKGTFKNRDGNNERDHARSFTEGRPAHGKKPFAKRPDGEKRFFDERGPKKSGSKQGGKPFGKKPEKRFDRADKPQGQRAGGQRYEKSGKPGFKKFKAA